MKEKMTSSLSTILSILSNLLTECTRFIRYFGATCTTLIEMRN